MSVLVLGATSPIARAIAGVHASQGRAVAVAARDTDEAQAIASDLAIRHGVKTLALAFEATDYEGHPALFEAASDALGPVEVVVVAFGAMGDQEGSQEDFAAARRVIDINYTGAASACEAAAHHMLAHGRGGAIVGISSVAGDRGRASNYFYGSAKGAFTLYLQGLRNRLSRQGVHVLTVKLGFVDTRMTFGMETGIPIATPEDVARAVVDATDAGTDVMYHPAFWAGIMGIIKAIPEAVFKRMSL